MATPLATPDNSLEPIDRVDQTRKLLSAEQQRIADGIGGSIHLIRQLEAELFALTDGKEGKQHQSARLTEMAA